jgi:hypothetical protein
MVRRKLTPEEQAAVDAAYELNEKRGSERRAVESAAWQEPRLALINDFLPDYKPVRDEDGSLDASVEDLPKWLGDMIENIEYGIDQENIESEADRLADEIAAEAAHVAWLEAYAAAYRKLFAERAALPVARRKGLVRYDDNLHGEVIVQPGESTEHVRWIEDDEERRRHVAMAQRGLRVVTDAA